MIDVLSIIGSVLIGALIAIVAVRVNNRSIINEMDRRAAIKEKMKEIDTLILLNKKIHDILQKREIVIQHDADLTNYQKIATFDDINITIDDFVFLRSFCSQNHYYLPSYMVEEFFKKIADRKVVMDPQSVNTTGSYSYSGARAILEDFSEQLVQTSEDRKFELKQLTKKIK